MLSYPTHHSCEQGMLWRQHPDPVLCGDQCDGFSVYTAVPPMWWESVSAKAASPCDRHGHSWE